MVATVVIIVIVAAVLYFKRAQIFNRNQTTSTAVVPNKTIQGDAFTQAASLDNKNAAAAAKLQILSKSLQSSQAETDRLVDQAGKVNQDLAQAHADADQLHSIIG